MILTTVDNSVGWIM